MIPDVNVVVAAARPDHLHHAQAKAWWLDALQSATAERPIYLLPPVISGFIRIVTHPKIFDAPSVIDAATVHIDALLALSNVTILEMPTRWSNFRQLCIEKALSGNAIPDAWIASTVAQHNEHLVTFDKDFRKLLPRSQVTLLKGQT